MPGERTCAGCRRVAARDELVRLVRGGDGTVSVDLEGHAPGRGAYLCPDPACFAVARRRRALPRALHVRAEACDHDRIERDLRSVWQRRGFTS